VVEVELPSACRDVRCDEGVDCQGGTCAMPSRDGGVPDAGPPDAGPPIDAGCATDEACDDGVACTIDRCTDGACDHATDDTVCEVGTTCDPVEGCPARACLTDADCDDGRACNG